VENPRHGCDKSFLNRRPNFDRAHIQLALKSGVGRNFYFRRAEQIIPHLELRVCGINFPMPGRLAGIEIALDVRNASSLLVLPNRFALNDRGFFAGGCRRLFGN